MAYTEYQIQEYSGKNYKNEATMERALANDKNWWGFGRVERYKDDATAYPTTRIATHDEAVETYEAWVKTYSRVGRRFRLVSREISDWEVTA